MVTATGPKRQIQVNLPIPHEAQLKFIESKAPRKIIRAGRRGGKTVGASIIAVEAFLQGRRVLYVTPTSEQLDKFWFEIKLALVNLIEAGIYYKNETMHLIEKHGTENRIRGKTAWNADMLRGDYADLLIMDEYQLMGEDVWELVGAPMLLDNNGDAVFIYTPPSLHSRSVSKARDPRHAAKMFKRAQNDTTGRWATFHFMSSENPHISIVALDDLSRDMTALAYRQEVLAEDIEEIPGALWKRAMIDASRVDSYPPLTRVVIGVDPPGGVTECGIVVAGIARIGTDTHGYLLKDYSLRASPESWASKVVDSYVEYEADRIVGEANYGGDMVENTIRQVAKNQKESIAYKNVQATRGKAVRAEPIVALYEQGLIHHVGDFPLLEEELCSWIPGESRYSPNRLDALVWAFTELMLGNYSTEAMKAPVDTGRRNVFSEVY